MVTRPVDRLGRLDPPPLDSAPLCADDIAALQPGATPERGADPDEERYTTAGRTIDLHGGARVIADSSGTDRRLPTRLARGGE